MPLKGYQKIMSTRTEVEGSLIATIAERKIVLVHIKIAPSSFAQIQ